MTTRTQIIEGLKAAKPEHMHKCLSEYGGPCGCGAAKVHASIDAAIALLEKQEAVQAEPLKYFVNESGRLEFEKQNFVPADDKTNPYYLAIDDACVTANIGTAESFATPKEALNAIIAWEIAVATDPAVNGGFSLQPVSTPAEVQQVADDLQFHPDRGPWRSGDDRVNVFLESDDSHHDVRLYVDGDFATHDDKRKYAANLRDRLNAIPRPPAPDVLGIVQQQRAREVFEAWYSKDISATADFTIGRGYEDLDVCLAYQSWEGALDELAARLRAAL